MFMYASLAIFALFTLNVLIGTLSGAGFLSDVGEMLILLSATILFVVGILRKEAAEKENNGS